MLKKLIFLLSLCLILTVSAMLAQEKEPIEPEKTKTEEARPVETKRENETKSNDNSSKSDNSSRNNSSSTSNERSSKREDSDSGRDKTPKKDRDAEERQPNKRGKDNDDEDLRQPKRPERPPVDNPNPPVNNPDNPVVNPNPNPPPADNNNNNQGRNRDKDKDDKDDKDKDDKKRSRNRNGGWGGGYPYPTYPTSVPSNPAPPFSMRDYFDKDDVFFDIYDSYIEKVAENYQPFFEDSPSIAFQPLYYAYGRKFFRNEFPWVSDNWMIYYESDLDDIFADFTTLGNVKYERMVMYPIGDTIKKVNKKFDYKGSDLRPVLVEKIPDIEQDKVYSFNVHDLPKGDYELRFIAKNGATVKHSIRIK